MVVSESERKSRVREERNKGNEQKRILFPSSDKKEKSHRKREGETKRDKERRYKKGKKSQA